MQRDFGGSVDPMAPTLISRASNAHRDADCRQVFWLNLPFSGKKRPKIIFHRNLNKLSGENPAWQATVSFAVPRRARLPARLAAPSRKFEIPGPSLLFSTFLDFRHESRQTTLHGVYPRTVVARFSGSVSTFEPDLGISISCIGN